MTQRDEAKIAQLNAKIAKTEEIKKLEAMKANYQSKKIQFCKRFINEY